MITKENELRNEYNKKELVCAYPYIHAKLYQTLFDIFFTKSSTFDLPPIMESMRDEIKR